eukprot:28964_1
MMTVFGLLLIFCTINNVHSWDNNVHRVGICQQGGPGIATSPLIHSYDFSFGWDEVEKEDNEWDFSGVEQKLDEYLKIDPDVSFVIKAATGDSAPKWLYKSPINVPACYIKNNPKGEGPWPYYLNKNYQTYFERYISKVYDWIINSKYYPKSIFVTQEMFGSTGDDTPWHGTPINKSCDISNDQWWTFDQKMGTYIYNVYYNSKPSTVPNLLLLYAFLGTEKNDWLTKNCPGVYRKAGDVSHGYQLNNEYNDYLTTGNLGRNVVQKGIQIRFRGETNSAPSQASGWWKEAPYWNMFELLQWCQTYGLDFPGF